MANLDIFEYLNAQGSVGSTADRTFAYLKGLGYSGTMNTQLFNWLRGLGYTGELPRMIDRFEKDNTGKY